MPRITCASGILRGEFYVLGLFAVLGMMVMISANSFLTVYLGLELLSLCCMRWWRCTATRRPVPRPR